MTAFAVIVLGLWFMTMGYSVLLIAEHVIHQFRRYFDRKRRFPTARIARRR